jgi:hypothetical protein
MLTRNIDKPKRMPFDQRAANFRANSINEDFHSDMGYQKQSPRELIQNAWPCCEFGVKQRNDLRSN